MHRTHLGHQHAQFHMELAQRSECVEQTSQSGIITFNAIEGKSLLEQV